MADYYNTLGVEKTATKEEIKKAYKKLAKKYHPDVNKEDGAEKKFKEINEAAAVLADDQKRAQYDQFGTTADQFGAGGQSGFDFSDFMNQGGGFDFDSIFDSFFSGGSPFGFGGGRSRGPQKGASLRYDLEITLEEAATGVQREISVPRLEHCETCEGSGAASSADIKSCSQCKGTGVMQVNQRTPFGVFTSRTTCNVCKGKGQEITKPCEKCDGTGFEKHTRNITVNIPAGAEEGTNLLMRGEGEAGEHGAPSGDLYIIVHLKKHKVFERQGDDIFVKVPIPFVVAAAGGEVQVPTLDGTATLKIPAGTESNTVFRMRDKGIPYLHGSGTGSQHVEVVIEVPKKLSKKQKDILAQFEKESAKKKGFFSKLMD